MDILDWTRGHASNKSHLSTRVGLFPAEPGQQIPYRRCPHPRLGLGSARRHDPRRYASVGAHSGFLHVRSRAARVRSALLHAVLLRPGCWRLLQSCMLCRLTTSWAVEACVRRGKHSIAPGSALPVERSRRACEGRSNQPHAVTRKPSGRGVQKPHSAAHSSPGMRSFDIQLGNTCTCEASVLAICASLR
jgi:hypothetical protein